MTKKIAVINDLSGFGRCSLTAAISVIASMGVQPCPLPTAVLSAQTGYPSYYCDDYTDRMHFFHKEWANMGVHFDGIYTGFVASEEQIQTILDFLDTFRTPDTFLLVDPVMGDNGTVYKMFTPRLCEQMKKLVMQADYITPNLTELCLLTDTDYQTVANLTEPEEIQAVIQKIAQPLLENGPSRIIVTGIQFPSPITGDSQMGNLYITSEYCHLKSFPYIGGSYSGTGDLFASTLAGGIARGDHPDDIIELAGTFIEYAMLDSVKENVPRNDGTNYEQFLWMLSRKEV